MTYPHMTWYQKKKMPDMGSMPPFHHRANLVNFLMLSDLFIFASTVAWMEFSQARFTGNELTGNQLSVYQISPLSLFTHNCDSYYTYIWIFLFNLSTVVALCIVVSCVGVVHQTSFSGFDVACFVFLILTLIIFIGVATFPIVAFISFFKLSVFVLSSFVHSNINIIPAIYSKKLYFPIHDNLSSPHSDAFYQKLFKFIHIQQPSNSCNIFGTLFTTLLIPVFAFFDCEFQSLFKKKVITHQPNASKYPETNDVDEYQLRVGIANKVLAEHYSSAFWIPSSAKYVASKLLTTAYSECTSKFIRELRGYTIPQITSTIRQSFKWEFKMLWKNAYDDDDDEDGMSFYDKLVEMQYIMLLFVFIPLQIVYILYALLYPYIIAHQIITDLYSYHSIQNYVAENQVIKSLFISTLSSSQSMWHSLYLLLSNYWHFNVFAICLILHFVVNCLIVYKLWNLRYVFEMCLNVMIVQDNSVLNEKLIDKMMQQRTNIEATKIRDSQLAKLFGRYHLDKLIVEYAGDMHQCGDIYI